MIFVYPAIVSDNIDRRYFPGIIKTMELYYLHHIAEAAASGVLNFYVIQNSNGTFSEVKLESTSPLGDYDPMKLLTEADYSDREPIPEEENLERINSEIKKLIRHIEKLKDQRSKKQDYINYLKGKYGDNPPPVDAVLPKDKEIQERERSQYYDYLSEIDYLDKEIAQAERKLENLYKERGQARQKVADAHSKAQEREAEAQKEKEKVDVDTYKTTGAASVRVDTQTMVDLRPTSISIEVSVRVIKRGLFGDSASNKYEPKRNIPISVKVVPMVVKNFDDVYSILVDDMYTNKYSALYKSAARSFAGKVGTWFGGALRKFINAFIPSEEVSVWRDVLLSRKGFTDAASFRKADRGPKYQKYAAALVVMSSDDIRHQEQNFFDNPAKMRKLFKLGWNSFGIMNDADQTLIFCSYYENGLCAKIPYNYLFHSLKATDIFKEMEQLGSFNRRVIGNFSRVNMRKLSENINLNNEVDKKICFLYNEYMGVIKDGS